MKAYILFKKYFFLINKHVTGCCAGVPLSVVQLHGQRDQLPAKTFPCRDGQGEVLGPLCYHYQQAQVKISS